MSLSLAKSIETRQLYNEFIDKEIMNCIEYYEIDETYAEKFKEFYKYADYGKRNFLRGYILRKIECYRNKVANEEQLDRAELEVILSLYEDMLRDMLSMKSIV